MNNAMIQAIDLFIIALPALFAITILFILATMVLKKIFSKH